MQPATPEDAKGLLQAAVKNADPVLIFEHKTLYKVRGPIPEGRYTTPIGKAAIRRAGSTVTVVASSVSAHRALKAAEQLALSGIDVEVVDLRTVRPMDRGAILKSVRKTARLVCVYEGVKTLGVGAEVSDMVAESDAFDAVCGWDEGQPLRSPSSRSRPPRRQWRSRARLREYWATSWLRPDPKWKSDAVRQANWQWIFGESPIE